MEKRTKVILSTVVLVLSVILLGVAVAVGLSVDSWNAKITTIVFGVLAAVLGTLSIAYLVQNRKDAESLGQEAVDATKKSLRTVRTQVTGPGGASVSKDEESTLTDSKEELRHRYSYAKSAPLRRSARLHRYQATGEQHQQQPVVPASPPPSERPVAAAAVVVTPTTLTPDQIARMTPQQLEVWQQQQREQKRAKQAEQVGNIASKLAKAASRAGQTAWEYREQILAAAAVAAEAAGGQSGQGGNKRKQARKVAKGLQTAQQVTVPSA